MKEPVERRKHKRFRARRGVFAAFKPHWLRSTILGEIIDIGRGGLALHYIPDTKQSDRPYKLKILLADGSFSLDKIPGRTISDFEIEKTFSFGSIPINRCGVQFGELTPTQLSLLEHFIRNYTIDE